MEWGQFRWPTRGMMCQKRSGRPMSTITKPRHMMRAVTASISPRMVISLIGPQS